MPPERTRQASSPMPEASGGKWLPSKRASMRENSRPGAKWRLSGRRERSIGRSAAPGRRGIGDDPTLLAFAVRLVLLLLHRLLGAIHHQHDHSDDEAKYNHHSHASGNIRPP